MSVRVIVTSSAQEWLTQCSALVPALSNPLRSVAPRLLLSPSKAPSRLPHLCLFRTSPLLQDGSIIPFGLCVWSTGVGPTPFVLRQGVPAGSGAPGRPQAHVPAVCQAWPWTVARPAAPHSRRPQLEFVCCRQPSGRQSNLRLWSGPRFTPCLLAACPSQRLRAAGWPSMGACVCSCRPSCKPTGTCGPTGRQDLGPRNSQT